MNKDEFEGGLRYVGGKARQALGNTANSHGCQVDGVIDQVAGGAQHGHGVAWLLHGRRG